jgi:recyclin-1
LQIFNIKEKPSTRKDKRLDFAAMDEFMDFILGAIKDHGSTAVRVFPPASLVLLLFSERLSSEVVSEGLVNHYQFTDGSSNPCRLGST